MRKTLNTIALIILFSMILTANYYDTHYIKKAVVTNQEGNIITVEDDRKMEWNYISTESIPIGTKLKVTFDTNFTDTNIEDDKIVKVKISG